MKKIIYVVLIICIIIVVALGFAGCAGAGASEVFRVEPVNSIDQILNGAGENIMFKDYYVVESGCQFAEIQMVIYGWITTGYMLYPYPALVPLWGALTFFSPLTRVDFSCENSVLVLIPYIHHSGYDRRLVTFRGITVRNGRVYFRFRNSHSRSQGVTTAQRRTLFGISVPRNVWESNEFGGQIRRGHWA